MIINIHMLCFVLVCMGLYFYLVKGKRLTVCVTVLSTKVFDPSLCLSVENFGEMKCKVVLACLYFFMLLPSGRLYLSFNRNPFPFSRGGKAQLR